MLADLKKLGKAAGFCRSSAAVSASPGLAEQRRHLMANILFLDQTADTAHVSVGGLLTNTTGGRSFSAVSSLNYEGWLAKGPDGWKIKRWHDFPDAAFSQ